MTREPIDLAPLTGEPSPDDVRRDHQFAEEAAAYLRASGLAPDEIEQALRDEVGCTSIDAHTLALTA